MKLFPTLLTILAVSLVRGDEDVCEATAQACVDILLSSLLGDTLSTEVCGELRYAISCLEGAADDCHVKESKEEVEDELRELESLRQEMCEKSVDRPKPVIAPRHEMRELEDISNCLADNEDVINDCIYEGSLEAMSIVSADASESLIQCAMYGMMAGCYVERVGEKCGDLAAELADREMSKVPTEIERACEFAGGVDIYDFNFENEKRRK